MTTIDAMLEAHPDPSLHADLEKLAACIRACLECAQACTTCADACLAEPAVAELTRCIRTDLSCSEVCQATAAVLSRSTEGDARILTALLQACAEACAVCAEECERHAEMHEHCRICAQACRRCEQVCRDLMGTPGRGRRGISCRQDRRRRVPPAFRGVTARRKRPPPRTRCC